MGRLLNPRVLQAPERKPAAILARLPRKAAFAGPAYAESPKANSADEQNERDSFRKLAFIAGLGMLFLRLSVLPELLATWLHTNTYLLYIVGPPAMLGAALTGGIGRTLRQPAARFWMLFFGCMLLSLPFSSWVGGSVGYFVQYALFSLPLLFTVGGLTVTWRETRTTFSVIGAAGVFVICTASFVADAANGRVEMSNVTGSIGNSNDLASQLILVLPFVLFIAMDKRRNFVIRCAMVPAAMYAVWIILGTASRGAVVALAACFVLVLFRGRPDRKLQPLWSAPFWPRARPC